MTESRKFDSNRDTSSGDLTTGLVLGRSEREVAIYLVVFALAFAAFLVAPMLAPGYNNAGDDAVHIAYCRDLNRSLSDGHGIFSWSDIYGLGAPRFIFRPPGFYISTVLLHRTTFGLIGIDLAEKLGYVVPFVFFPLSVAFLMASFGFRPLAVGLAALFSITPISTWGHTLDAYFYLGLAKQVIAIFVFPIALGLLHLTITKNIRYLIPAIFANVYMFLNHPYMSYCLFLVLAVYLVAYILVRGLHEGRRAIGILSIYSAIFALLLGFYLVPFYSSPDIQKTTSFSSGWRYEFEIVCQTVYETSRAWLAGGIFDTTANYRFGTEDWGWRDNAIYNRWPILTYTSLLGFILCLVKPRDFAHTSLVFIFMLSAMLFTGPDDFPLLLLLPAQDKFQYLHSVFLLELVVICMGGLGGSWFILWVLGRVGQVAPQVRRSELATGLVLVTCASILIYSPYQERYWVAQNVVDIRDLGSLYGASNGTDRPQVPLDRDFDNVLRLARGIESSQRIYFAPTGLYDPIEVPYSTVLSAATKTSNVINGFFSVEVGNVNYLAVDHFRSSMRRAYSLLSLFNVHYIVAHKTNLQEFAAVSNYLEPLLEETNSIWIASRIKADYDLLFIPIGNPIFVKANWLEWEQLNKAWTRVVANAPSQAPEILRPLIKYSSDVKYAEEITDIIVMPSQADEGTNSFAEEDERSVALFTTLDESQLYSSLLNKVSVSTSSTVGVVQRKLIHYEPNRIEFDVTTGESQYVALKIAYYEGWKAFVDGSRAELYSMSPGYCSVYLPAGNHRLELRYEGPNNKWLGFVVSSLGLAALGGIWATMRRRYPVNVMEHVLS